METGLTCRLPGGSEKSQVSELHPRVSDSGSWDGAQESASFYPVSGGAGAAGLRATGVVTEGSESRLHQMNLSSNSVVSADCETLRK